MISEGKHMARPTSWGLSESKNGSEQYAIGFEIVSGDEAGQTITWYGSFANEMAFEITMKGIRAAGGVGTDLNALEFPDTPVEIVVAHEEYNGKIRDKVRFINGGGGGIRHMDAGKSKSFAAKMASRIKAFDAKNGAPPAPTTKAPTNGRKPPSAYQRQPGDDDVGFP